MEWNRRKLESSIAILQRWTEDKPKYETEAKKIAGAYWEPIKREIKERCASNLSRGGVGKNDEKYDGGIQILFPNQIEPLLAECKDRLDVIKREEYDRELDNKSKYAAIKANKIAKCAIIITV